MTINLSPLQEHFDNITNDLKELFERVNKLETQPITTPSANKIKLPHGDTKNKLSPLMVEMLLFAYHSGHKFHEFPSLQFPAQQQAYNFFLVREYFYLRDFKPTVALTEKGNELVARILNPGL